MPGKVAQADLLISKVAARQHGVVSARQLREAGLGRDAVSTRVAAGRLHRLHRGVYAVGYASRSWEERWMAAVLSGGRDAVLSHASAAALWRMLRPVVGPVDVATPARSGRARRKGIRLHRLVSLRPDHCTRRLAIPVTTPARTLSDLRGSVPERLWRRAIRQAEIGGLETAVELESGSRRVRSDLEDDFLRLCRRNRLPEPEVNVRIGRWTVDFLWRRAHLVVETDSYAYHRGRIAFQDDRARDLDLRRRGFDVIRISERQLNEEAGTVLAAVKGALARLAAS